MIELNNVSKTYQMGDVLVKALDNVSVRIEPGEFVAIMGASGSGKSTLLHIMGFLDRPDSGTYLLCGKDISRLKEDQLAYLRNHYAGFVFQQFYLLASENALQNTMLPLIYSGKRPQRDVAEDKLKIVGLDKRMHHRPNQLSGGEQQRVAIARCLVNDPLFIFADEPTGNLDTKSEEEIIAIFKELNEQGKTVVMVTHEPEIAAHAKRIIRMRDGNIIEDKQVVPPPLKSQEEKPAPAAYGMAEGLHSVISKTEIFSHIKQAVHSIISHKMRSFLSMLGILIGVASVIAMLALGRGATESIRQGLTSLGSNLLMVRPGSHRFRGVASEQGAVSRFTLRDVDAIARLTDKIKAVSATVSGSAQAVYGNKNWRTQILGTNVDYASMRAYEPVAGRFFSQEELLRQEKVAVIGLTVVKELFDNTNPVGLTIAVNRVSFRVVGVLPEKGSSGWRDMDDIVIIPVTTAMNRLLGKDFVDSIDVEVRDSSLMESAQDSIRQLIMRRHRLGREQAETAFEIRNMAEIQAAVETTTKTMNMLLGSIAGISLLVGGIGIMNIMLVAVKERTKEIGLRKAMGARNSDILTQFLIESMAMTLFGGAAGVVLGIVIAFLLSSVARWRTDVTLFSVLLATVFSVIVGMIFGIWPARQAAKLDPIYALRYE